MGDLLDEVRMALKDRDLPFLSVRQWLRELVERCAEAEAEVERLRALVKDAYDEGQEDCPDDKFYGRTGQWKDSNACADLTKENAAKETP